MKIVQICLEANPASLSRLTDPNRNPINSIGPTESRWAPPGRASDKRRPSGAFLSLFLPLSLSLSLSLYPSRPRDSQTRVSPKIQTPTDRWSPPPPPPGLGSQRLVVRAPRSLAPKSIGALSTRPPVRSTSRRRPESAELVKVAAAVIVAPNWADKITQLLRPTLLVARPTESPLVMTDGRNEPRAAHGRRQRAKQTERDNIPRGGPR